MLEHNIWNLKFKERKMVGMYLGFQERLKRSKEVMTFRWHVK